MFDFDDLERALSEDEAWSSQLEGVAQPLHDSVRPCSDALT